MNTETKKGGLPKLFLIALMSLTIVFTASACNSNTSVSNDGSSNALTDGVDDAPEITADPIVTDEVSTP